MLEHPAPLTLISPDGALSFEEVLLRVARHEIVDRLEARAPKTEISA